MESSYLIIFELSKQVPLLCSTQLNSFTMLNYYLSVFKLPRCKILSRSGRSSRGGGPVLLDWVVHYTHNTLIPQPTTSALIKKKKKKNRRLIPLKECILHYFQHISFVIPLALIRYISSNLTITPLPSSLDSANSPRFTSSISFRHGRSVERPA